MRALDNEGEDVVRPPPGSGGGIRKQSVKKGVGGVVVKVWLLLDGSGETPQVIEAGKHAIMRRTGLPARDLRIVDPLLSYPSTLLGRERAIVINLQHIKAIITAHEVLLLNSTDPSVTPFVHELHSRILRHHHHHQQQQQEEEDDGMKILPFEFVALEACLEAACRVLDNEAKTLEQEAQPALDKLTSNISTLNLERVRQIKSRLVAITGRVQKIRDELEHLLDDDEDMAEMYLTHKLLLEQTSSTYPSIKDDNDEVNIMDNHQLLHHHHHHRSHPELSSSSYEDHQNNTDINSREESSHHGTRASTTYRAAVTSKQLNVVELEMLLEAYFVQIEGTLNKLSTLREYVDDTEDYINIMLDDKQNHLLQMGVMLSTATAAVTAFIVVMGILGINIHYIKLFDPKVSGMREFIWTVGGCTAGTIFLFVVATAWYKHKRLLE